MTILKAYLTSFLACFIVITPTQVHVTFLVIQMHALVGIQYANKGGHCMFFKVINVFCVSIKLVVH